MTHKTIKLLALFIVIFSSSFAQEFEGEVIYENSYKSKIPNVTDEQLTTMLGNRQEFFIKGGNYKSTSNGTVLEWQLYVNQDNKLYNKMSNSPALLWNDAAANTDEVIKAEINKGVLKILGYSCDELILTCKSGVEKYYFSSKIKIDPAAYEKHKFGHWSDVTAKSHSLPIKMIIANQQFSLESVATEIKPMKLASDLFQLPPDSKLEKSPY